MLMITITFYLEGHKDEKNADGGL